MIPLANPDITCTERRQVIDQLYANNISGTGPKVREFEELWELRTGRKRAFAVSNGTVALEIALQAIGVNQGDEVIVPALTFAAPAAAVRRLGALPVLVDVDFDGTIDVEQVERAINYRTRAIIGVDTLGNVADFNELMRIAKQHGLYVIEDAAEAHGSTRCGKVTGSFGHISTFSFHANKIITTGEGGMILLDDDDLIGIIELIRNHGMRKPYVHEIVGTNGRMTNLTAAIGVGQMGRFDEIVNRRNEIDAIYNSLLPHGYFDLKISADTKRVVWLKTIGVNINSAPGLRDRVVNQLRADGIDARAIWTPLSELSLYRSTHCPIAAWMSYSNFWLPTFHALTPDEFYKIGESLRIAYE